MLLLAAFGLETLIQIVVVIVVVGLLVWVVESFLPIPEQFKLLIRVVAIIGILIYLLKLFGLF